MLAGIEAEELFDNLARSAWTWPIQLGTAAAAIGMVVLTLQKRAALARLFAAVQVALVVIGWGLAMNRSFILPDMTLARATRSTEVMPALTIALGIGAVILVPSLFYLYRVFKRT